MFYDEVIRALGDDPASASALELLRRAPVIGIQNVFDWLQARVDQLGDDGDRVLFSSIPNLTPMAPAVWVEWIQRARPPWHQTPCGVLFVVKHDNGDKLPPVQPDGNPSYRWMIHVAMSATDNQGNPSPYMQGADPEYFVSPAGRGLGIMCSPNYSSVRAGLAPPESMDPVAYATEIAFAFLRPALLAMAFARCDGATLSRQTPEDYVQRARMRRGLAPLARWHQIDMDAALATLTTHGSLDAPNSLDAALLATHTYFNPQQSPAPLDLPLAPIESTKPKPRPKQHARPKRRATQ